MLSTALVFVAAFSSVFLGCFQAINVVRGRRFLALVTSLAQSAALLTLYRIVPTVHTPAAAAAFVIGAVLGGQLSMTVTRRGRS